MKIALFPRKRSGLFRAMESRVKALESQLEQASSFIYEIEKGNLSQALPEQLERNSAIGAALASMRKHIRELSAAEEKRNWMNTGLATFADILRNKKSLSLAALADEILLNLVKYVGANQGGIFILEGEEKNQYLRMIACYAYNRKKHLDKRVEIGEGLVGQCFLEKLPIFLKEIPADYVNITSGLGDATPRTLLIQPLLINEDIFGVIELASIKSLEPHHLDFVNKLSENIAATIRSVRESDRTLQLLNASQVQAEELRAQEEEMRQNMEELQATQEEMQRKSDQLSHASAEITGIMAGIDATMATIEFSPDGTVLKANGNFLKTMKYSMSDIAGRHHRMFVPPDVLASDEYKTFWQRLAAGESFTGLFHRINSVGESVWLNAIYNPVRGRTGEVTKVVKFATDVTAQQEGNAASKGILSGIDATMATIEFRPDGTILTANDKFLATMKYGLSDIVGKHHRMFATRDDAASAEYKLFWERLSRGEAITGTFKRVSSIGDTVWLNAVYNPIFNASNQVVKVVKYATDITAQQEMLAQTQGLLQGINATMAMIEFSPQGIISTANENFLSTMKYRLAEIKGRHHRMFVAKDEANSEAYRQFWERLAAGEAINGTFSRVDAQGNRVVLKAIYNPTRNANGDVVKIVKLATEVSGEAPVIDMAPRVSVR